MSPENVKIGNRTIAMDNLDKVIFPEIEYTQGDLLEYYRQISDVMLPYMENRPLTLQRFPDGITEEGFYQKAAPDYFPDWISTTSIKLGKGGRQKQVICNNVATLAYLVDQGCITFHIWQSREDKINHPDRLIFDLDPPDDNFSLVKEAAFKLKDLLEELELNPFVMTTGSRGLHLVVPLRRSHTFDEVRSFAKKVADYLAEKNTDLFTTDVRKKKRNNRLFLDYLRNAYGQNSVAPYSVRAKPEAPVATPLDWSELKNKGLNSQTYTVKNIMRRMGQKEDPWKGMQKHACLLDKSRKRLKEMVSEQ